MIYSATAKGPFKFPGYYDKDGIRFVGLIFRPDTWAANTVYYFRSENDFDTVIPTVFTGMYYRTTNPGRSGTTEPVWPTLVGDTVEDNGIIWEAVAYNLLPPTESISASSWTATDSVVLASPTFTATTTQVKISDVPTGITSFSITNHYTKNNGEEDDITLQFKVAER